jgi:transcriptional regulator with XRE-family HTH domain
MDGARLKRAREKRALTQEQLGLASGLGQSHISRLERGAIKQVKGSTLLRLTHTLGVTADYLLGKDTTHRARQLRRAKRWSPVRADKTGAAHSKQVVASLGDQEK